MTEYVLSPRAQADIDEIWDYTADRWNDDQAERYTKDLQRAIDTLARNPRKGRPCDQLRPGYRKFSVGAHVVFFRVVAHGIEVVRVLHQRMDFEQHL
jgi:toxin ParE1/3/4